MKALKKQQKIVVLLAAVVIIWGLIGQMIYKSLHPLVPEYNLPETSTFSFRETGTTAPFYEVAAAYRDPFLGKYPQKKKTIKRKIIKQKITVPFPNIIYNGMIEGNKTQSHILTINGQQEILKLGETFAQIKLIKANSKEAIVRFQGINKTFLLEE